MWYFWKKIGKIQDIHLILSLGADINKCNESGKTPLLVSILECEFESLMALLTHEKNEGLQIDFQETENGMTGV